MNLSVFVRILLFAAVFGFAPSAAGAQASISVTNTVRALLDHADDGFPASIQGIRGERLFGSAEDRARFEDGREEKAAEKVFLSHRRFGSEDSYILHYESGMRAFLQGGLEGIEFGTLRASVQKALPGDWEEEVETSRYMTEGGRIGSRVTRAVWSECEGQRGRFVRISAGGVWPLPGLTREVNGPLMRVSVYPTPCPGQAMRDWQVPLYGLTPSTAIPVRGLGRNTRPSGRLPYLLQLQTPNGDRVRFQKLMPCCDFRSGTYWAKLDRYEVSFPGQEDFMVLYLNIYEHAPETLRAPAGLALAPEAGPLTASSPQEAYRAGRAAYEAGNRYRSIHLLREAVEGGVQEAEYYLGEHAFHGSHMKRDYAMAAELFRVAAEAGDHVDAQVHLGEIHLKGLGGLPENPEEALRLFMLAAATGDRTAQFFVGRIHALGAGKEKDEAEAVRWYRLAAEAGHATALNNLGALMLSGSGTDEDPAEAARLFRAAAEGGNVGAHANLAFLYSKGRGVQKDCAEAIRWYRLAAKKGHSTAAEKADALEEGC